MPFLYVGNLGIDYDQEMIERDFKVYGRVREVWHWPSFGYCFFELDSSRDCEDAIHEMNGAKSYEGKAMQVQFARRPRKHLPSRATPHDKCYICNRYGHFARDCPDIVEKDVSLASKRNRGDRRSRSPIRHVPAPRPLHHTPVTSCCGGCGCAGSSGYYHPPPSYHHTSRDHHCSSSHRHDHHHHHGNGHHSDYHRSRYSRSSSRDRRRGSRARYRTPSSTSSSGSSVISSKDRHYDKRRRSRSFTRSPRPKSIATK